MVINKPIQGIENKKTHFPSFFLVSFGPLLPFPFASASLLLALFFRLCCRLSIRIIIAINSSSSHHLRPFFFLRSTTSTHLPYPFLSATINSASSSSLLSDRDHHQCHFLPFQSPISIILSSFLLVLLLLFLIAASPTSLSSLFFASLGQHHQQLTLLFMTRNLTTSFLVISGHCCCYLA